MYKITNATFDDDSGVVKYTAKSTDGNTFTGQLTQNTLGQNTVLTDAALQQLAEKLVGVEVKKESDL